jgi:hypothetical protein
MENKKVNWGTGVAKLLSSHQPRMMMNNSVCASAGNHGCDKDPEPRNNKFTIFHIHNKDWVRKHINKPKQEKPLEYNVKK